MNWCARLWLITVTAVFFALVTAVGLSLMVPSVDKARYTEDGREIVVLDGWVRR